MSRSGARSSGSGEKGVAARMAASAARSDGKSNGQPAAASLDDDAPLAQVAQMLVTMGFKPVEADRAVAAVADDAEGEPFETLMKRALAQLS